MNNYKGLNNIGNTCYLNSVLQMLVLNKDFCNVVIEKSDQSQILKTFTDFIHDYFSQNDKTISPTEIKKFIESKQHMFIGYSQQDAGEFLLYLLDILNDEAKGSINNLFQIETITTLKCKYKFCLQQMFRRQKEMFLILPIQDDYKTLDDCYRGYKQHEILNDDNMVFCDKCQTKRKFSTHIEIENWNKHLIIWLKRFNYTQSNSSKNNQDIEIPVYWRHNYNLQGAIIHFGDVNGGHYIYLYKHWGMNKWFIFDDNIITCIEKDKAKEYLKKAYLLYYTRKFEFIY